MAFPKRALKILKLLYQSNATSIKNELINYISSLQKPLPPKNKKNWHKELILYCVYADKITYSVNKSPLQNLMQHIPHIKTLECNALHILPIFSSPMIDGGFDVSDHYSIRKNLGTKKDLQRLINKTKKENIHLFIDLVLNHVSNQHEWAIKAFNGDPYYRRFFITKRNKPHFLHKIHKKGAVFAKYRVNSKTIAINISFPEQTGLIPHWVQAPDGYWYYHTFYPEQLELNWNNPQVFIEMAKVMLYWSSYGFNFRLDAIPYVGKSAYKIIDPKVNNKKVYLIIDALKAILQLINPNAVFIAESYEDLEKITRYFGTHRQPRAELAYNFYLSTCLWLTFVKRDTRYLWQMLKRQMSIPKHASWLNFLRNHDELSLACLTKKLTRDVNQALLKHGANFREGHGIAGRTFSLLNCNQKKFLMAYSLLASLPGSIMLPYGDEIGAHNIPYHKLPVKLRTDLRNINRGNFFINAFSTPSTKELITFFSQLFTQRKKLARFFKNPITRLPSQTGLFSACYEHRQERLFVYINLTPLSKKIKLKYGNKPLYSVNKMTQQKDNIFLGAYAGIWLLEGRTTKH